MGDYAEWDVQDRIDGNCLPYDDCDANREKKRNHKKKKRNAIFFAHPPSILWKIRKYAKAVNTDNEEFLSNVFRFATKEGFEWQERNNGVSSTAVMYLFVWNRRDAFKKYFNACYGIHE